MSDERVPVSVAALDALSEWCESMRSLNYRRAGRQLYMDQTSPIDAGEVLIRIDERAQALMERLRPFMWEIDKCLRQPLPGPKPEPVEIEPS